MNPKNIPCLRACSISILTVLLFISCHHRPHSDPEKLQIPAKPNIDPIPECTTVAEIPDDLHDRNIFSVSFSNQTRCVYSDKEVHIQFLAQYRDPIKHPDPAASDEGKILSLQKTDELKNGYPEYKVVLGTPDTPIPSFTLADLKSGSFYFNTDGKHFYGARFLISLGDSALKTVYIWSDGRGYTQPNISLKDPKSDLNTPFEIFEFGYDPTPNTQTYYVFNTSFVDKFSIPLWFTISSRKSSTNPNSGLITTPKHGIELKDGQTREQVIENYKSFVKGPHLFTVEHLKSGIADKTKEIARILSPADKTPFINDEYFDRSFEKFFGAQSPYQFVDEQTYPFHFCTEDPGLNSSVYYPGCASSDSSCPNISYPACNSAGNQCVGQPPVGYRDIGDCFKGYVKDNTLYFWHYQNDTGPSEECDGSVSYNKSTEPINHPPKKFCQISKPPALSGKCALQNDCFVNDDSKNPNTNVKRFNTAIMAAVMRGVVTNKEERTDYTFWRHSNQYYAQEPYNWYAKFWHEIGIDHKAYGFGYDDSLNESPAYTPNTPVTNISIGIQW